MPAMSKDLEVVHQHDWRINPFVKLASNPPKRQLVCTGCNAVSTVALKAPLGHMSSDRHTWPKYDAPVAEQMKLFD